MHRTYSIRLSMLHCGTCCAVSPEPPQLFLPHPTLSRLRERVGWGRPSKFRRTAIFSAPSLMKPIRKAILPVAGLGTRFLPATKAMPKEMLPVVDRPLIQHVVDEARQAGIEHFIFVTGRNKGVIEDHFDRQFDL